MKRLFLVAILAVVASCGRGSKQEAEQAVRTYIARLIDAYRTSDESLVDPLVSDQQGMKLLGLIGVKRDAGVVLDAKLLEIQFVRTAREGGRWVVETKERWYYRDRRIGSGAQVGPDSTDSYTMRYSFSRKDGKYILEDLSFAEKPQVGRTSAPVPTGVRALHGLPPKEPGAQGSPGRPPATDAQMPAGHPDVKGASGGVRRPSTAPAEGKRE